MNKGLLIIILSVVVFSIYAEQCTPPAFEYKKWIDGHKHVKCMENRGGKFIQNGPEVIYNDAGQVVRTLMFKDNINITDKAPEASNTTLGNTKLKIKQLYAKDDVHKCVLLNNRKVACWKVPYGMPNGYPIKPKWIKGISNAKYISVGSRHGCAIINNRNRTVKCWGTIKKNSLFKSAVAKEIMGLKDIIYIDSRRDTVCVVDKKQYIKCNPFTNVQDGLKFEQVGRVEGIIDFEISSAGICALNKSGLTCWSHRTRKKKRISLYGGKKISSTCVLLNSGHVKCWGEQYVCGREKFIRGKGAYVKPDFVTNLSGSRKIAGGYGHHCVIIKGGKLLCWGGQSFW